ncbi:uncharacterized protein JCM6883_006649 [Sporobolomyces salmoneus]|uniref:uncharacterized protein n=1 Tax=Sporobolomyces salmoneus TaxID=183962 RepID=UPI0031788637
MSLSKLPVELKRVVIKHAAEGDRNYACRHESGQKSGKESKKSKHTWRGRSIHALSLVNKEWRSLTVELLFTTLRSSKAKGLVFDGSVRGTDLGDTVTTLVIDARESRETLANLLFYILPLFPNIRNIATSHRIVLDRPELTAQRFVTPSASYERLIWNEIEKLARDKAIAWRVHLDEGWRYGPIVFANPHTLRALEIETGPTRRIPLLETSDSEFTRLLSTCTSLETLKMTMTYDPPYDSDAPRVCEPTLSLPFASKSTLRSLDVTINGENLDRSLLLFAAKFSSLRYLRVAGEDFDDPHIFDRVKLSELKHLEIANIDELSVATEILTRLSLPKLLRLDVQVQATKEFIPSSRLVTRLTLLDNLFSVLEYCAGPSSACYLHHSVGHSLVELYNYPGSHYSWDEGSWAASLVEANPPLQDDEASEEEEEDAVEYLTTAINGLAGWTRREAETLRMTDWVGLKDLWQQLRGVNELKKYKED